MIVRHKRHTLEMLLAWRGSVLKKIYPRLILLFVFSLSVYVFHYNFPSVFIPLNITAFTLLGISLAIFLGFCNNAAYDRYWEGRKLWGNLLNVARSLTYQITNYIDEDPNFTQEDKKEGVKIIIAFMYALKRQLRKEQDLTKIQEYLSEDVYLRVKDKKFIPSALLHELSSWIKQQQKEKRIDTIIQARIDQNIHELSIIMGGCERILHTGIPFAYFVLLDRTVYIYCFILPFGLIDSINWATPFFVTFIGYSFIALEAIVAEIAEPFGTEENDLALTQICQNIEHTVAEIAHLNIPQISQPDEKFMVK
ncbi:bestrophin family protein [Elizabethkingia sp. JS20170427COW]|uniref:bestrophin family protein n=1 Tax=Elizabethkingia sp. JS20170427COW TaxID=2583851 RepID=UPI001110E8F4|nr:bestrophin family ion channel [Elizabethkingia sp. JS20170427COW]QCX53890.1 hypothetical protein FGE20_09180 [Elizabethkingia sp. JS20170427COW]